MNYHKSGHRNPSRRSSGLWSVVLAGGEGKRLRPFIRQWLGFHLPKQYCTFTGTKSLLQHTLARAGKLAPDERTLVVIDRTHKQFAEPQLAGRPSLRMIAQPCNRDTAPGIFLPLAYIRSVEPRATVVIYPSDHFVFPESRYIGAIREAAAKTAYLDRLILLGVVPDKLELEYGWIQPGSLIADDGCRIRSVDRFIEKPTLAQAKSLMEAGAMWNTFVLIGTLPRLWELGWAYLPEMMPLFEQLGGAIGSDHETKVISSIYESMPTRNFSRDLLQRASQHTAVMKLEGVFWSDWGNQERIIHSLGKIQGQEFFSGQYTATGRAWKTGKREGGNTVSVNRAQARRRSQLRNSG